MGGPGPEEPPFAQGPEGQALGRVWGGPGGGRGGGDCALALEGVHGIPGPCSPNFGPRTKYWESLFIGRADLRVPAASSWGDGTPGSCRRLTPTRGSRGPTILFLSCFHFLLLAAPADTPWSRGFQTRITLFKRIWLGSQTAMQAACSMPSLGPLVACVPERGRMVKPSLATKNHVPVQAVARCEEKP